MLPLDDPRWAKLSSPGGPTGELLAALRELQDAPDRARPAIGVVFDYACHQYSVYRTTVAVVPHLVRAAGQLPPNHHNRYELLAIAGRLALLVGGSPGRLCPARLAAPLEEAFTRAVAEAAPLAAATLLGPWAEGEFALLLAALAAFKGHTRVGFLLSRAPEWVACPRCGVEFEALLEWGRSYQ